MEVRLWALIVFRFYFFGCRPRKEAQRHLVGEKARPHWAASFMFPRLFLLFIYCLLCLHLRLVSEIRDEVGFSDVGEYVWRTRLFTPWETIDRFFFLVINQTEQQTSPSWFHSLRSITYWYFNKGAGENMPNATTQLSEWWNDVTDKSVLFTNHTILERIVSERRLWSASSSILADSPAFAPYFFTFHTFVNRLWEVRKHGTHAKAKMFFVGLCFAPASKVESNTHTKQWNTLKAQKGSPGAALGVLRSSAPTARTRDKTIFVFFFSFCCLKWNTRR